ncbi:MAG TPA: hypothetical protein VGE67_00840 [Haloferula sp.]
MDDPRTRHETSLTPLGEGEELPAGMSAEDHERWKWQVRLDQLVMDEMRAWRRLAWGAGIYFGLLLLMPLGVLIGGGAIFDHMSGRPAGFQLIGGILQYIAVVSFLLLAIPILLRLARWVVAMWRRRRFSSTAGADPGQPQRR